MKIICYVFGRNFAFAFFDMVTSCSRHCRKQWMESPPSEQTIINDIIPHYLETSDKSCLIFRDSAKYGSEPNDPWWSTDGNQQKHIIYHKLLYPSNFKTPLPPTVKHWLWYFAEMSTQLLDISKCQYITINTVLCAHSP